MLSRREGRRSIPDTGAGSGSHSILAAQGGSQEGYARWELFRRKGLDLYAAHRNNAMKR